MPVLAKAVGLFATTCATGLWPSATSVFSRPFATSCLVSALCCALDGTLRRLSIDHIYVTSISKLDCIAVSFLCPDGFCFVQLRRASVSRAASAPLPVTMEVFEMSFSSPIFVSPAPRLPTPPPPPTTPL